MPDNPNETIIYLIRHGEVHNPRDIYYGRCPRFHLSEKGRAQAQTAAAALAQQPLSAMFSSPLLRARQTAKEIGLLHGTPRLHISRLLLEVNLPYDGNSNEVARGINWEIYRGIDPQYEQPGDVLRRMRLFLNRVHRQYRGQQVAAVSHHHPILFTTLWAMGKPVDLNYRTERTNLGLSERFPIQCAIVKFKYQSLSSNEIPVCTVLG